MPNICVENRPLIGTAQVYVSLEDISLDGECFPTISSSTNAIDVWEKTVLNEKKKKVTFRWPGSQGHISQVGEDYHFSDQHKSLTFRLRISPSGDGSGSYNGVQTVKNPLSEKRFQRRIQIPCFTTIPKLPAEKQEILVRCAKCGFVISTTNLRLNKLLPLPSSNWKDITQDWFCYCCNAGKEIPLDEGVISNKQLAASNLIPSQPGDFFYTSFSLFASRSNFLDAEVEKFHNSTAFRVDSRDDSFGCSECSNELGMYDVKSNLLQFWHHGIQVDMEDNLETGSLNRSIGDTLGSIVTGIIDEMMGRQVQICLQQRSANQHLSMTIFEPSMNFYTAENVLAHEPAFEMEVTKKSGRVCKVFFELKDVQDDKCENDINIHHVEVSSNILQESHKLLEYNQKFIEPFSRFSGQSKISILFC